jgi:hypothetical protein
VINVKVIPKAAVTAGQVWHGGDAANPRGKAVIEIKVNIGATSPIHFLRYAAEACFGKKEKLSLLSR